MPQWPVFQPSLPIHQTAYNMSSYQQQSGQSEPVLPSYQSKKLPSRPSTAENRRDIQPHSSPIQVTGSADSLRREYILWQIRRNTNDQSVIQSAFRKIEEEMYSLLNLRDLTKSDWKEMGIPLGLGKRLATEVKSWLKEYQNQSSNSSLDDLVTAALATGDLEDSNTKF